MMPTRARRLIVMGGLSFSLAGCADESAPGDDANGRSRERVRAEVDAGSQADGVDPEGERDGAASAEGTPPDANSDRDAGGADDAGDGAAPVVYTDCEPAPPPPARIDAPCAAPFPTGYCLHSEAGDYIGGGRDESASGPNSVRVGGAAPGLVTLALSADTSSSSWNVEFLAGGGKPLTPGLYEHAERYPFQGAAVPGLSITGNGRGCNTLTGRFSVDELERLPTGLRRLSITFEQHCEGGATKLSGVIHVEARGEPDAPPAVCHTIPLQGKISRVAYDPASHVVYGVDATNRRLARIDLSTHEARYEPVVQTPSDLCIDTARGRLYTVNKGSSLLVEYDLADLSRVRDFAWSAADWSVNETSFEIHCTPDRLYVVDGAWGPGLTTVDGLDDAAPSVVDRTALVSSVGGLVVNAAGTDLYVWEQYGWSAGNAGSEVRRLRTDDLARVDAANIGYQQGFYRDPLDAPILLDERHGLVFAKDRVFDALNLTRLVYTLPGATSSASQASENVYASDAERGVFATRNFWYDVARFDVLGPTLESDAEQMFYDRDGLLWFLQTDRNTLRAQVPPR